MPYQPCNAIKNCITQNTSTFLLFCKRYNSYCFRPGFATDSPESISVLRYGAGVSEIDSWFCNSSESLNFSKVTYIMFKVLPIGYRIQKYLKGGRLWLYKTKLEMPAVSNYFRRGHSLIWRRETCLKSGRISERLRIKQGSLLACYDYDLNTDAD